jgi:hypothetical protein
MPADPHHPKTLCPPLLAARSHAPWVRIGLLLLLAGAVGLPALCALAIEPPPKATPVTSAQIKTTRQSLAKQRTSLIKERTTMLKERTTALKERSTVLGSSSQAPAKIVGAAGKSAPKAIVTKRFLPK